MVQFFCKYKAIYLSTKTKYLLLFALVFFFFLVANARSASAGTYYVTKTGNDTTGDGSSGTPWLTIKKAEATAANGDTVNVSAGTYAEDTYWNASKSITWNADGEVIVRGSGAASYALRLVSSESTVINGFTFDSEGTRTFVVSINSNAVNKTLNDVTFSGSIGVMINNAGGSDITIQNSTFTMTSANRAFYNNPSSGNITLQGNTFNFPSGGNGIFQQAATTGNVIFTGNIVTGTTSGILFQVDSGDNVELSGNTITTTSSTSSLVLTLGGSGTFDMKDNVINFTKTTNEAIFFSAGTWDLDIDGNTITSTAADMDYATIFLQDQDSPLVRNNTIDTQSTVDRGQILVRSTGTDGGTLQIIGNTFKSRSDNMILNIGTDTPTAGSGKLNGAIIENNTLYGPIYYDPGATSSGAHGIYYSQNVNGIIRYNTIIGLGFGVVIKGTGEAYTSGGVYYNRIINSNATSSVRIKGVKDVPVYNNSIWSNSSLTNRLVYSTKYNVGELATGTILKNNIMYGSNAQGVTIETGSETGFTSNYNNFYRDTGARLGIVASINYDSLGSWQAAGYDANGHSSDPLFSDKSNYDLSLLYNSPDIDSGISISGLSQDILGNPIYGTPDIGAYEYQPPYSIGTDEIDIGGDVRIYADGKFRNTKPPSSTTANLSVIPVGGFGSGEYSEWMNIDISTWNNTGTYRKAWTESSSSLGSVSIEHIVGDLRANRKYLVKANNVLGDITGTNCSGNYCTSNSSGEINFVYTGGYSTVPFEIEQAPSTPVITDLGLIDNIPDMENLYYFFTSQTPVIKGICEVGDTVHFEYGENDYTTTCDANGEFTLTISNPSLPRGEVELVYYQVSSLGGKSSERILTLMIGIENFPDWLLEKLGLNTGSGEELSDDQTDEQITEEDKANLTTQSEIQEETNPKTDKKKEEEEDKGTSMTKRLLLCLVPIGALLGGVGLMMIGKGKKSND